MKFIFKKKTKESNSREKDLILNSHFFLLWIKNFFLLLLVIFVHLKYMKKVRFMVFFFEKKNQTVCLCCNNLYFWEKIEGFGFVFFFILENSKMLNFLKAKVSKF